MKMMQQVRDVMESKLLEMTDIALKVASNNKLNAIALSDFFEVYEVRTNLSLYGSNSFIANFALYLRGGDYVYTSQSTYTLPMFFQSFRYPDQNEFIEDLNQIRKPTMRVDPEVIKRDGEHSKHITFLKPLPLDGQNPYGTAIFIVREDTIRQMLRTVIPFAESNVIVINDKQEIVTTLDESNLPNQEQFNLLLNEAPEGTQELQINDRSYLTSYVSSQSSHWTYIMMVPKDVLMANVHKTKNRALAALAIIFVVGAAIIYLTVYLNLNPIRKLFTVIESLRQQAERTRPASIRNLLIDLVQGGYTEKEEFNLLAQPSSVTLRADSYHIVLIDISQLTDVAAEQIVTYWQHTLQATLGEFHLIEDLMPGKIGLIIGEHQESDRSLPWTAWIQQCEQQFNHSVAAGIGNSYEGVDQLGKSYLEAVTALQYQYALGSGQAFYFGDKLVMLDHSKTAYSVLRMEILQTTLNEGSPSSMHKALTSLTDYIEASNMPLVMAKFVYWDLINLLTQRGETVQTNDSSIPHPLPDLVDISLITSMSILKQYIREAGSRLIRQHSTPAPAETGDKFTGQDMLHFVDQHFKEYNFSLQMMANHFNVTPTYMSKVFKRRTGTLLSEYLNQRRMTEARQLLLNTDMSLQNIVDSIGYSDVSSFIRKFKQMLGVSPGEFKKANNEQP
jgi:AraC-like DNA-binding protein